MATPEHVLPVPAGSRLVRRTEGVEDPMWDRFVETAPTGHYTQSVTWARFRAAFGWATVRAMVWDAGVLVAGAQVLVRRFRGLGSIGYLIHGPVVTSDGPELAEISMRGVLALCRREKVRYLVLRPAPGDDITPQHLPRLGFRRNDRLEKASLTTRVDLTAEPEVILARMRKSTRTNIRRGLSRGLTARRGDGADLDTVLHLYRQAAARKGFPNPSISRYRQLWRSLEADGRGALFVVEDGPDPVSAQLAIRFGDRLYSHIMVWSGAHAKRHPNELLDWTAMMWARTQGCRYYDLEGLGQTPDTPGTDTGDRAAAPVDAWASHYKRGFGGEIVAAPSDHDHVVNPLLRWGHTQVLPRIEHRPAFRRLDLHLQRIVAGRATTTSSQGAADGAPTSTWAGGGSAADRKREP